MFGRAGQTTALTIAVIGALIFAYLLGLRGIGAFEEAATKRMEQSRAGAPVVAHEHIDNEVAHLHADGRMALAGSALTLSMLIGGLLGLSLHERRQRHVLAMRVESLIRTDTETGAANRRAWEERLAHELAQSRRLGYAVTIALVEVDHLKAFTKKEGRDAGDRLLSALAGSWVPILRRGDLMGRFSSGVFALLLPGCPAEQAEALLGRLCRLVPEQQSVSAGVATWHWRESTESLFDRTHAALEQAKGKGGDRVALSPATPPNVDRPAHKRMAREVAVEEAVGYESGRHIAHHG